MKAVSGDGGKLKKVQVYCALLSPNAINDIIEMEEEQ